MNEVSKKQDNPTKWETTYHIDGPSPFEKGDPDTVSPKRSIYKIISGISILQCNNKLFRVYIEYDDHRKRLAYSGKDRGRAALEAWDKVVETFIGGPPSTWLWRGLTDKRKEYIRKVSASSWAKIIQVLDIGSDYDDCIVERSGRGIGSLIKRLDTANWVLYCYHTKFGYPEGFFDKNY
jgi:hypothetical protein